MAQSNHSILSNWLKRATSSLYLMAGDAFEREDAEFAEKLVALASRYADQAVAQEAEQKQRPDGVPRQAGSRWPFGSPTPRTSGPLLEQIRAKAYRVLDVPVAKVRLQRPRIAACVGQREAARMTKHVMDLEPQAGRAFPARSIMRAKPSGAERSIPLAHEYEGAGGALTMKPAKRP